MRYYKVAEQCFGPSFVHCTEPRDERVHFLVYNEWSSTDFASHINQIQPNLLTSATPGIPFLRYSKVAWKKLEQSFFPKTTYKKLRMTGSLTYLRSISHLLCKSINWFLLERNIGLNPLRANPIKWSNTLKSSAFADEFSERV